MDKIDSSQISVLVQGPINGSNRYSSPQGVTHDCLKAIRQHLPQAEIVLSTWKGANVEGLVYDKVLLNDDPGAVRFCSSSMTNSNNRIIVSTKNGLEACSNKYCLKLRSDAVLQSSNFLDYFDRFPERSEQFPLFERKVIACSNNSVRYFSIGKKFMFTPFHISDWVYFGLTSDLKLLYNVELAKEPQLSEYFRKNKRIEGKNDFFMDCNWQFPPEQYITYNAFKNKFPEISLKNKTDYNYTNIRQSDQLIMNNFIVLEPKLWGFIIFKDFYYKICRYPFMLEAIIWNGIYRHTVYKRMYNKIFKKNVSTLPQVYEILRCSYDFLAKHIKEFMKI